MRLLFYIVFFLSANICYTQAPDTLSYSDLKHKILNLEKSHHEMLKRHKIAGEYHNFGNVFFFSGIGISIAGSSYAILKNNEGVFVGTAIVSGVFGIIAWANYRMSNRTLLYRNKIH